MITKQLVAALWQPIKRRLYGSSSAEYLNDVAILQERDAKPSHCLLKIESFKELSDAQASPCIVNKFKAGGYMWNLCIYPKGDENNDGKNYISIYLEVAEDMIDLPRGWEINATFNFFIYDQFRNKYVGLQDARKGCFHSMNNHYGVAKFIDLKTFHNLSKGFIVNDVCIFGVEVFIACAEDCLTFIREPEKFCKYKWKVDNFSKKISDKWYKSDFFIAREYKWRILLNPNCDALSEGSVTIGLELDNSSLPPNHKLLVNFLVRLVDQKEEDEDIEFSGTSEFYSYRYTDPANYGDRILDRGVDTLAGPNFISLAELQNPKMGYLVNDTCIIEVEIDVLALHSSLSDDYFYLI